MLDATTVFRPRSCSDIHFSNYGANMGRSGHHVAGAAMARRRSQLWPGGQAQPMSTLTSSDAEAKSGFYTKEHPDQANHPVLELSLTTQAQQLRISDLRGTLNTDNDCNLYVADLGR